MQKVGNFFKKSASKISKNSKYFFNISKKNHKVNPKCYADLPSKKSFLRPSILIFFLFLILFKILFCIFFIQNSSGTEHKKAIRRKEQLQVVGISIHKSRIVSRAHTEKCVSFTCLNLTCVCMNVRECCIEQVQGGWNFFYILYLWGWGTQYTQATTTIEKIVFLAKSNRRRCINEKKNRDFSLVVFARGKIPQNLWLCRVP
jgi:hypothetical protein